MWWPPAWCVNPLHTHLCSHCCEIVWSHGCSGSWRSQSCFCKSHSHRRLSHTHLCLGGRKTREGDTVTKQESGYVVTDVEEQSWLHRLSQEAGMFSLTASAWKLRWGPTSWKSRVSSVGVWEEARQGHEDWTRKLFYLLLKFSTLVTLLEYFHLKMEKLWCASGLFLCHTLSHFSLQDSCSMLPQGRESAGFALQSASELPSPAELSPWTWLLSPTSDSSAILLNSAKG